MLTNILMIGLLVIFIEVSSNIKKTNIKEQKLYDTKRGDIIIKRVEGIIRDVVQSINQRYVDEWKYTNVTGKLTDKQKETAKQEALLIINRIITKEIKELLNETYGDISDYLDMAVEVAVRNSK